MKTLTEVLPPAGQGWELHGHLCPGLAHLTGGGVCNLGGAVQLQQVEHCGPHSLKALLPAAVEGEEASKQRHTKEAISATAAFLPPPPAGEAAPVKILPGVEIQSTAHADYSAGRGGESVEGVQKVLGSEMDFSSMHLSNSKPDAVPCTLWQGVPQTHGTLGERTISSCLF